MATIEAAFICGICETTWDDRRETCPVCDSTEITERLGEPGRTMLALIDGTAHKGRGLASHPDSVCAEQKHTHEICLQLESLERIYRIREHPGFIYWRATSEMDIP